MTPPFRAGQPSSRSMLPSPALTNVSPRARHRFSSCGHPSRSAKPVDGAPRSRCARRRPECCGARSRRSDVDAWPDDFPILTARFRVDLERACRSRPSASRGCRFPRGSRRDATRRARLAMPHLRRGARAAQRDVGEECRVHQCADRSRSSRSQIRFQSERSHAFSRRRARRRLRQARRGRWRSLRVPPRPAARSAASPRHPRGVVLCDEVADAKALRARETSTATRRPSSRRSKP